ncbi:MAG: DUF488 domain-containing protein [Nitrospira sp.]
MPKVLWTIGHSTRSIDQLVALLNAHGVQQLVDVRAIPRSRHTPQFNKETLLKGLQNEGLLYTHMAQLGGLRKPRKESINQGWRNNSFRGYADYMQTDEFWSALDELIAESRTLPTAIMCAEAVPWRCHRSLIADALVSRGWEVRHIMAVTKTDRHQLTPFATVEDGRLRYPTPKDDPRLFP